MLSLLLQNQLILKLHVENAFPSVKKKFQLSLSSGRIVLCLHKWYFSKL